MVDGGAAKEMMTGAASSVEIVNNPRTRMWG
jgi:hypothetical protein